MRDYAEADFYTDPALIADPHAYFAFLRNRSPVSYLPHRNVVAVTGFDETVQVMLDTEHFSSVNAVIGGLQQLPFTAGSDDISEEVAAMRGTMAFADQIVTTDGPRHADLRSILARLFTPTRLKALEATLVGTADALIDEFIADGRFDLVRQYGRPFTTLIIADLLGVPADARQAFREILKDALPAQLGASSEELMASPIAKIGMQLFGLIAERRQSPQGDILTELAQARYPDGSEPSLVDLTALGAFLFGAGQDTTNHLMGNGLRLLAVRPDIQDRLRAEPHRIPDFIEEVLRYDGSVKGGGRLCIKTTTLGGVEIKAGTPLLLTHMGANRDPRRFENPDAFDMDRPRAKEHVAFGRGAHTCIGAPLARAEARVSFERLLARLGNIRLAEAEHGPPGAHRFDYEPTYILRALKRLRLEFDPIG